MYLVGLLGVGRTAGLFCVGGGDAHKSRDEIYKELIAKSKAYKAERQKQKIEDEMALEKLDDELDGLRGLLNFRPKKADSKQAEFDAMMRRAGLSGGAGSGDDAGNSGNAGSSSSGTASTPTTPGHARGELTHKQRRQGLADLDASDDFDVMAKSLLFEARAQASNRTKTPAEKAQEERERMEALEQQRLRRQMGDFDDDEEEDGDAEGDVEDDGSGSGSGRGDMLGSNFVLDPTYGVSGTSRLDEEECSDAELVGPDGTTTTTTTTTAGDHHPADADQPTDPRMVAAAREMPYVLPCPRTVGEFIEQVGKWCLPTGGNPAGVAELVARINKCHSVHLPSSSKAPGASNRGKIGRLYRIVLTYLGSFGGGMPVPPPAHAAALVSALFRLGPDVPAEAGAAFRGALTRVFRRCVQGGDDDEDGGEEQERGIVDAEGAARAAAARLRRQRHSESAFDAAGRRWPTVGELLVLRAAALLFPATDFRHPVTTPLNVCVAALLSGVIPVRDARDAAMALHVCELQLDMAKASRRLAPEAINMVGAFVARLVLDTSDVRKKAQKNKQNKQNKQNKKEQGGRKKSKAREARAAQRALAYRATGQVLSRVPGMNAGRGGVSFMLLRAAAVAEEGAEDPQAEEDEAEDADEAADRAAATLPPALSQMPTKLLPMVALGAEEDEADQTKKTSAKKKTKTQRKTKRKQTRKKEPPAPGELRRTDVLVAAFALLERSVDQFSMNVALPEMFADMVPVLGVMLRRKGRLALPARAELRARRAVSRVTAAVANALDMRQPCRMQAKQRRAVPIRQQRPMFDENYIVRKDNDPDKERAELKSLKRKIKREQKAVARDVRRDALFVAQEQERVREAWEADIKSKYNKAVEFVNQQHAQAKAVQREGVAHGGGMVAGRRFKRARHASSKD